MAYKGVILVSVPLLLGLVLLGALFLLLKQTEHEVAREQHSRTIVSLVNTLGGTYIDSAYTLSGYCYTKSEELGERYDRTVVKLPQQLDELADLVRSDPEDAKSVERMKELSQRTVKLLNTLRHSEEEFSDPRAVILLLGAKAHLVSLLREFLDEAHKLVDRAQAYRSSGSNFANMSTRLQQILAFGIILNIAMSFLLAVYFSRAITGRLKTVVENTLRFGRHENLHPTLKGTDEIASLDNVFHNMATTIDESVGLLKQSEARVRVVLESMPVGLIIMNQKGFIENVNVRTEQMLGYPAGDLRGKHLSTLISDQSNNDEKAFMEQILQKAVGRSTESIALRNNGQTLPVDLSISQIDMNDGPRLLTTMLDVTDRHEMERLKREFVAMISHDLKTPLSSIVGNLALVATGTFGSLSDRGNYILKTSEKQVMRLIDMIGDLLLLEKMESDVFELHLGEADLSDVLQQSIQTIERIASQSSVKIEAEDTKARVLADGSRLVQVLVNLLSNAVKFSPANGVVKISVDEKPDWVEVRVKDQGRGVPVAQRKKIFEKFRQVESSDALEKGGTGLGLPICKLIIERHGGTIGVESEDGEGSTFWFRIPRGNG